VGGASDYTVKNRDMGAHLAGEKECKVHGFSLQSCPEASLTSKPSKGTVRVKIRGVGKWRESCLEVIQSKKKNSAH